MRIMFVQYAGDFREAFNRLQESGTEIYYGHRYILEQAEGLLREFGEVAFLCCLSPEAYQEVLPNGVTVIGAKAHPRRNLLRIRTLMKEWGPTHLVVVGPLTGVIRWGINNHCTMMCQFADSFEFRAIMRFLKFGRLAKLLNHRQIDWVANHGVNACRSLMRIGVEPAKVIPWDWPYTRHPDQMQARTAIPPSPASLLYVGSVTAKKGVGDVIAGLSVLKERGFDARLTIVGGGETERFRREATTRGVADRVNFAGIVPNNDVFDMMTRASAVVVPSRHSYPEGLPLTIYEALCARVPIVASDHPMFAGHLVDRQTAMVFPAKEPTRLADQVQVLFADPTLYAELSTNGAAAWKRMQNAVKWGDLIRHWLRGQDADLRWLAEHKLAQD